MSTSPPTSPTSRAFTLRFLGATLLGATLAVAVGTVLFLFGLDLTPHQRQVGASLVAAPALLVLLLLALWIAHRQVRPIRRYLSATSEDALSHWGERALVRALNLPALAASRVVLMQMPSFGAVVTAFMLVANDQLTTNFRTDQLILAWLTLLFVGTGHAILEYIAISIITRPIIRDIRARGVGLSDTGQTRVIPVSMRRKFFAVALFAVTIPLVILGATVLLKVNRLMAQLGHEDGAGDLTAPLRIWIVLLIAGCLSVTLLMSLGMGLDVMRSTAVLIRGMRRVERNELATALTPTTTDEFSSLFEGFNRMVHGLRERRRLHDALGRYVAPHMADEAMKDELKLGGQTVTASVLFADIRDFTTLSEQLEAVDVVAVLNDYFAAVELPIEAAGGWINKFGGDSLLAVFGAPEPYADHAARAVTAALGMRTAVAEFNVRQAEAGRPQLRIGIGVDCGAMVAGNVGAPARMEYTVIGDTVNVAARIQGLTKEMKTDLLISDAVYGRCSESGLVLDVEVMPLADLKGKSAPVQVYAVRAAVDQAAG